MASIVIAGGGIVALTTAMLLADDGHAVTVLERDPAAPPDPSAAWERWERKRVSQFRLPHLFVSRFRIELERELPRVITALEKAGALRFNPLSLAPAELAGRPQAGDSDNEMVTGRRPVVEAAIAAAAQRTAGVTVRRGVTVAGLLTAARGRPDRSGIPHVTGVHTARGEQVLADLVVDATGRRSPLPRWLAECGARPPAETIEDSGFVYYARHFRSGDGSLPAARGPGLQEHGSVSSLTLPADNGTWAVVIVASAKDAALHGLHDADRWSAAVCAMPLVAHWIDAEPLEHRVAAIAGIEDRHRSLVIDGKPVAAGVVPLADAWACTNPSLGRGVSLGVLHGRTLRDTLRRSDPGDRVRFATDFHASTTATMEPWYRATVDYDRHRLAEIGAHIRGRAYDPGDEGWDDLRRLQFAARRDPECLRASLAITNVLRTPDELLAQPGLLTRARMAGQGWQDVPLMGPSRSELTALARP